MGHLGLLVRQRFVLKRRNLCGACCELLAPLGVLFLLVLISRSSDIIDLPADNYAGIPVLVRPSTPVQPVLDEARNFLSWAGSDGSPTVMQSFSNSLPSRCQMNYTIAVAPTGPEADRLLQWLRTAQAAWWPQCENTPPSFASEDDAVRWARTTGAGRLLALVKLDAMDPAAQQYDYTLRLNLSQVPSTSTAFDDFVLGRSTTFKSYLYSGFTALMQLMDTYVACLATAGACDTTGGALTAVALPFPVQSYKQNPFYDAAGGFVALVFALAFMFPFSKIVKGIVEEKELRLKEGMLIMGLSPAAYPLSWVVVTTVERLLSSLLATLVLRSLFQKGSLALVFCLILLFNVASASVCFFLGAVFSKSRTAALFAVLYLFANILPILVLPSDMSLSLKGLLSLMPAMGFGYAIQYVTQLEGANRGAGWGDLRSSTSPLGQSVGLLLFDILLYHFLAWYCGHVVPGEFGVPKRPWFFLLPSFWCPPGAAADTAPEHEHELGAIKPKPADDPDLIEAGPAGAKPQLRIHRLRKVFDSNAVAVADLDLTMYEDQITVLLGHNGAGKTTTINMLTGMIPATGGDATIFGHSIRTGMHNVRRICGVCPQHNILWPAYTVAEHLRFFARLKGMPPAEVEGAVTAMIRDLRLEDKRDVYSAALSGGMKRRLSVGIALIGGSRLVFLDEPTAGMDPEAREHTHALLTANTAGRVIVLTTHFMDEADKLGDRIAIMSKGGLRCCGSPLFLKSRLGVGYNLTVALRTRDAGAGPRAGVTAAVVRHVPEAVCRPVTGMEMPFLLPMDAVGQFAALFRELETRTDELEIDTFGIAMTKLEDVFMKIALEGEHEQAAEDDSDDEGGPDAGGAAIQRPLLDEADVEAQCPSGFSGSLDDYQLKTGAALFAQQLRALVVKRFHCARRDRRFVFCLVFLPVLVIIGALLLTFITSPNPSLALTPAQFAALPGDLLVATLRAPATRPPVWRADEYAGSARLVNATGLGNSSLALSNHLDRTYYQHAGVGRYGAIVLGDVLAEACCYDDPQGQQFNANGAYRVPLVLDTVLHNTTARHALPTYYAELNKARLRGLAGAAALNRTVRAQPLPRTADEQARLDTFKLVGAAIIILFPFTFIPVNFAAFLVKERACKAKHVQLVSGVSVLAYWLASFLWDTLLFGVTVLLSLVTFAAFGKEEYVGDAEKAVATALLFLVYGMASTALAYLCQFPFTNHSTAQNVLMMGNLVFGVFLVIAARIMALIESTKEINDMLLKFYRLVPSYCLGEGLLQLSLKPLIEMLTGASGSVFDTEYLGRPLTYMAIEIPAFFLLTLACDWGGWARLRAGRAASQDGPVDPDEDPDVAAERAAVEGAAGGGGGGRAGDLVAVQRLRKVYPAAGRAPPKTAVHSITFGVAAGEIFGFLGVNGAGKSTTLSILSGEFAMTGGRARINGCDVATQLRQAQRNLGFCPQFDALLDLMTVEEHLWLYARLRGMPADAIPRAVDQVLKHLGLADYRRKRSKKLSGGNKRKLSVGIAVVGGPRVVLLDEPSAGMDVVARHQMCQSIIGLAHGRSVILTTHHLEEVEALANRVGIMVAGRFRCLGTLQRLKDKFGEGYWVDFRMDDARKRGVLDFVGRTFGAFAVEEEQPSFLRVKVTDPGLKLSTMFESIVAQKEALGVKDYAVSQPNLEQVFLRISAEANPEG